MRTGKHEEVNEMKIVDNGNAPSVWGGVFRGSNTTPPFAQYAIMVSDSFLVVFP